MSQTVESKEVIYEFGKFVLDPNERVLLADGKPIHLTDKVFDTLLLLVRHNGRLITKDEMMASIWEESFVEEGNLAKNISRLRKILNVNGRSPIETLPRRGYRFTADVREIDGDTSLLVRRNLRVKITHTNDGRPGKEEKIAQIERIAPAPRPSRFAIAVLGILLLAAVSGLGLYFWDRERAVAAVSGNENGAIRLTDFASHDIHPQWTRGDQIHFVKYFEKGRAESFVMDVDGGRVRSANETIKDLQFGNWSPDGLKVLFYKEGDAKTLYLANADGSDEMKFPVRAGNLDWSSDGKQIVYQEGQTLGNAEIFVYTIETGTSKNITNGPAFDADPAFSPDGKQIVFVSGRDGNPEVYLMNVDGSNLRRLTNHPAFDNHPVFSPDGTQIAFNSDRENENSNIYLMRADGSDVQRLTDWPSNETVEPGCWSPDGTRIAISSDKHGSDDIFVVSAEVYHPESVLTDDASDLRRPMYFADGKQILHQAELPDKSGELRVFDTETKQNHVLLKTNNADTAPVISPDGTRIAFQTKIESNTDVYLINADGSGLTNLTNNPWRDGGAAFSPDGGQIVFSSNRDGHTGKFNLYMMNADGGDQRLIYSAKEGMSGSPVFSPDGASILFANDFASDGNFEIFKIRPEPGETAERLTFRGRYDGFPAFSPDGQRVAFISSTDGNSEIYLMNTDGTSLLRLTRNAAEDTLPQFSTDGKRIIFSSDRGGRFAIYEMKIAE
jgi:TolB protein